jgi:hypothetical protein
MEVPTSTGHNTIMNIISCQYKSGIVRFAFLDKEINKKAGPFLTLPYLALGSA